MAMKEKVTPNKTEKRREIKDDKKYKICDQKIM